LPRAGQLELRRRRIKLLSRATVKPYWRGAASHHAAIVPHRHGVADRRTGEIDGPFVRRGARYWSPVRAMSRRSRPGRRRRPHHHACRRPSPRRRSPWRNPEANGLPAASPKELSRLPLGCSVRVRTSVSVPPLLVYPPPRILRRPTRRPWRRRFLPWYGCWCPGVVWERRPRG